jgi:hypothetical protein
MNLEISGPHRACYGTPLPLHFMIYDMIRYYITYLLTEIGLTPGGSSTVHIYTQTVQRTTQLIKKHRTTQLRNDNRTQLRNNT